MWSCWLKTPGKCIHKDLDEFYAKYLEADRVVIISAISMGLISGRLKTVLDRLIPHYLPYIEVSAEGSNHFPRYEKYPDIEFYYEDLKMNYLGTFIKPEAAGTAGMPSFMTKKLFTNLKMFGQIYEEKKPRNLIRQSWIR